MTDQPLFIQNTIAVIWDFDCTLIPGYMQQPLFDEYGVNEQRFWAEVNELPELYAKQHVRISRDTVYLNHILSYVEHGKFKELTNQKLKELGSRLTFYPGMPDFLEITKAIVAKNSRFAEQGIEVEHYIISTGLKAMIEGSAVHPYVDGIWACEFIENVIPPGSEGQLELDGVSAKSISQIGYMLDNTTKTRAIFEINKGTNTDKDIDVNASIPDEHRRVPIPNMIYIADGPSDIPCFSIINHFGGKTYAVYERKYPYKFAQVVRLGEQRRVNAYGEADYQNGSSTFMWIELMINDIAERIVESRESTLKRVVQSPPNHIIASSGNGHVKKIDKEEAELAEPTPPQDA